MMQLQLKLKSYIPKGRFSKYVPFLNNKIKKYFVQAYLDIFLLSYLFTVIVSITRQLCT